MFKEISETQARKELSQLQKECNRRTFVYKLSYGWIQNATEDTYDIDFKDINISNIGFDLVSSLYSDLINSEVGVFRMRETYPEPLLLSPDTVGELIRNGKTCYDCRLAFKCAFDENCYGKLCRRFKATDCSVCANREHANGGCTVPDRDKTFGCGFCLDKEPKPEYIEESREPEARCSNCRYTYDCRDKKFVNFACDNYNPTKCIECKYDTEHHCLLMKIRPSVWINNQNWRGCGFTPIKRG